MAHDTAPIDAPQQLELFAALVMPEAPPAPRRVRSRGLRRTVAKITQFMLDLRERVEEAAEDWVDRWTSRPIVHEIVPASQTKMPETRAVASIFDLGYHVTAAQVIEEARRGDYDPEPPARKWPLSKPLPIQERVHTDITREAGVIRCKRLHHTETKEWQEQEAARRARQIVPKPQKQAFRMGKKAKASQEG